VPKFGVPTEEQLAKINKLAKRTLSADEVFVFPTKLVGDMIIPNRYVQLTKELLDVYAEDAKKGVALMLDHSWSPDGLFGMGGRPKAAIPYGRTFDSHFDKPTEENETVSLMADHYMVRGIELDGIKTDDLIASIEAGTLFDTSIGFSYDNAICSICGNNYRNYEQCKHVAGKTYEIEENGVTKNKLCFIQAKPPGFLMENSLVFDGAYPGAGIMSKAGDVLENENGIYEVVTDIKGIEPDKSMIAIYGQRTGLTTMVKKANRKKVFSIGDYKESYFELPPLEVDENNKLYIPDRYTFKTNNGDTVIYKNGEHIILKGGESKMNENVLKMLMSFGFTKEEAENLNTKETSTVLEVISEKWKTVTPSIIKDAEPLNVYMTQEQVKDALGADLKADEVLNLAKEGQEYRKHLIDEALAMGVRAQGNDFPAETWKNTFATMSTKAIRDIMKTFEAQAKSEIPAGRKTDPEAGFNKQASLPDEAFMV